MAVRFDHAAADEAVHQLVLTADALTAMVTLLHADAPLVTTEWRGRFRRTFDVESGRHVLAMMILADSLRTTAVGIRTKQYQARVAVIQEARAEAEAG